MQRKKLSLIKWEAFLKIEDSFETNILNYEVILSFMKFKICLYFLSVFWHWRGSVASYTTDERSKSGQKERWRLNLEEIKVQIKSSSEKFRRLLYRRKANLIELSFILQRQPIWIIPRLMRDILNDGLKLFHWD